VDSQLLIVAYNALPRAQTQQVSVLLSNLPTDYGLEVAQVDASGQLIGVSVAGILLLHAPIC